MDSKQLGRRGEDVAAAYLERAGMTIINRNWRCNAGEVDIVAIDGVDLVLVEVKTRRTSAKGTPEEAVTPAKQRRIARIAESYIASAGLTPACVRFDVISLRVIAEDRALLRHHVNAFSFEV